MKYLNFYGYNTEHKYNLRSKTTLIFVYISLFIYEYVYMLYDLTQSNKGRRNLIGKRACLVLFNSKYGVIKTDLAAVSQNITND